MAPSFYFSPNESNRTSSGDSTKGFPHPPSRTAARFIAANVFMTAHVFYNHDRPRPTARRKRPALRSYRAESH